MEKVWAAYQKFAVFDYAQEPDSQDRAQVELPKQVKRRELKPDVFAQAVGKAIDAIRTGGLRENCACAWDFAGSGLCMAAIARLESIA